MSVCKGKCYIISIPERKTTSAHKWINAFISLRVSLLKFYVFIFPFVVHFFCLFQSFLHLFIYLFTNMCFSSIRLSFIRVSVISWFVTRHHYSFLCLLFLKSVLSQQILNTLTVFQTSLAKAIISLIYLVQAEVV